MTENKLKWDIKNGASCDFHRLVLPFQFGNLTSSKEVLIFNRNSTLGRSKVEQLKGSGVKIVVDIDDYWILPEDHYLYDKFGNYMRNELAAYLRLADLVITTTHELAYQVSKLNKNVVIIPNSLPFDEDQFTLSDNKESLSPLVYVAGASHRKDSFELGKGTFGSDITFAGYEANHPEWSGILSAFPKACYKGSQKLPNYMSLYNGHKISVAPLSENKFNICKSNLKMLEAGAKGLPIITSLTAPYLNPLDKNVVLYAEDPLDWQHQFRMLTTQENYYEDVSEKLKEHVRTHYQLKDANKLRQQALDSL